MLWYWLRRLRLRILGVLSCRGSKSYQITESIHHRMDFGGKSRHDFNRELDWCQRYVELQHYADEHKRMSHQSYWKVRLSAGKTHPKAFFCLLGLPRILFDALFQFRFALPQNPKSDRQESCIKAAASWPDVPVPLSAVWTRGYPDAFGRNRTSAPRLVQWQNLGFANTREVRIAVFADSDAYKFCWRWVSRPAWPAHGKVHMRRLFIHVNHCGNDIFRAHKLPDVLWKKALPEVTISARTCARPPSHGFGQLKSVNAALRMAAA